MLRKIERDVHPVQFNARESFDLARFSRKVGDGRLAIELALQAENRLSPDDHEMARKLDRFICG